MRLFAAKITPSLIGNSNNDPNTNIKIVNLTLGESLRANCTDSGHILITCD
jgi:hypothetical protein